MSGNCCGVLALGFSAFHACFDACRDEGALELGKAGHDGEDQLSLGRGGVDVLLEGDEVHAQALKFRECVDKCPRRAGKPVVAPDKHYVYLALADGIEHGPVVGTVFVAACRVVDKLAGDSKAAGLGVGAELAQLGFWALLAFVGGDAGVDRNAEVGLGAGHEGIIAEGGREYLPAKKHYSI
jgi:hypothetical protein